MLPRIFCFIFLLLNISPIIAQSDLEKVLKGEEIIVKIDKEGNYTLTF